MSVLRPLTGYRLAEVRPGDTLQELAARELGDAARWADIVAINALTPPYLTGDATLAGPGVKLFGQLLIVPAATVAVSAETDPDAVFGRDLDLTDGTLKAEGGDLQLIAGRGNLRQALRHRVVTRLRELLFHPSYGCGVHAILGKVNGPTESLLAARYVAGALASDDRVRSVDQSSAAADGDVLSASATVTPIVGAPVEVTF